MSEFLDTDDDVLQMIEQIKKITKESKRKFENEIDTLIENTKIKLLNDVDEEKLYIKERNEKIKNYKNNIIKNEKQIKEVHKLYQKLKSQLSDLVNNYKNKIKEFYDETEKFIKEYENEKKELDEIEEKEWKDLNLHCIEILNNTKDNICARKNESDDKFKKVLASII